MTATVLVVDDLEQNVKLLEAKLLSEYYVVFTASNGLEAIDMLSKHQIDVILLDGMMPGIDGFETCRKIKANPDTMHVPIVIVTALSDVEDRIKGLEAGADEFLTKPFDDLALFARVNSLSRTKAVIDELKLRNKTNAALGGNVVEMVDNFSEDKVLIIDDDVIQAKNITKTLSKITPHITLVKEISQLPSEPVDLIIISCQIEGVDPLRVLADLRATTQFKNSAYIFLAEEENTKVVIKGMEFGINDYFSFPVDENELLARMKTQLRRKKYQDELRRQLDQSVNLSMKDSLTGAYNRRYFDAHVEQLISSTKNSSQKLSLLMIDIDHFKNVNDTYGHQAGDEVLKAITSTLMNNIREVDLFARYGGEEFCILYSGVTGEMAVELASRLKNQVEKLETTLPESKGTIVKTISIGVAEHQEGETLQSLIERADKALYSAKSSGRNRVVLG